MRNISLSVFGILYAAIYVRYEMVVDPTSISSVLGMTAFDIILVSMLLMFLAHHINYLEIIRQKKVSIFRICLSGLLAIAPPTIYEIFAVLKRDKSLLLLILLLAVFLCVMGRALFASIIELVPDLQILTAPPKSRSDINPLDAMLIFMFAMPFIAKIFH